jgi:hypothetical protein
MYCYFEGQLFFNEGTHVIQWRKDVVFDIMWEIFGYSYAKWKRSYTLYYMKNSFKIGHTYLNINLELRPGAGGSHLYSSYSRSRDQNDHSLKPVWANSLRDFISKNPFTIKGLWSGSSCRPWVQAPGQPKKKRRTNF